MKRQSVDVLVIGGGISGLTAAFRLKALGKRVALVESSTRVGGKIDTRADQPFPLETGPNSILVADTRLIDLFKALGIESHRVVASKLARNRFVLCRGKLQALPMGPGSLLTTSLFGWRAKASIPRGLFRALSIEAKESVSSVFARLFHRDLVSYAVAPFVSGIYAGDAERLIFEYAFPKLYRAITEYGSLSKGMRKLRSPFAMKRELSSFRFGISTIPKAFAKELKPEIISDTEIRRLLARPEGGYRIEMFRKSAHEQVEIDCGSIFMATPASQTASMIRALNISPLTRGGLPEALEAISYPPLAVVNLVYPRATSPALAQTGFGFLIPPHERADVLGVVFSSTLFPSLYPSDKAVFTLFMGGRHHPEVIEMGDQKILETARMSMKQFLGVESQPEFEAATLWAESIPQFEAPYAEFRAIQNRLCPEQYGIHLYGNYTSGVSVPDCILKTWERVEAFCQRGADATRSYSTVSSQAALGQVSRSVASSI